MVTLSFTIFSGQKNYNRAHMLFQVLCGFEPIFYTTHPNEESKIITLKEGEKMNIFYSNLYLNIEKEGQKIKLKILEQNIEIDKKNEISKKGRKQLEEWFSMSYVFTYDLSRQGYNEMIQKLDEHSNNRKDALNKCYNQIRTNYFKKHKNCYCS